MFNPKRLVLARHRRQLTMKALAAKVGVTSKALSNFENGHEEPSQRTLELLADALRFPLAFFEGPEVESLSEEAVSFRALTKMRASERHAALGAGVLALELSRWIDRRFGLPKADLPDLRDCDPESAAIELRTWWGLGERPVSNMIHLAESRGVRVFSLDVETGTVDAFSHWRDETPFVFLNMQKSGERSRFDMAHELGHLVMHRHGAPQGQAAERAANEFASAFLMPRGSVLAVAPSFVTVGSLLELKKGWLVSASAVLYRLTRLGIVSRWQSQTMYQEISRRGYRSKEPFPIKHEASQLLAKVFAALRAEGKGRNYVANELRIEPSELDALVFGLVLSPALPNRGAEAATQEPVGRPGLKLV